MPLSVLSAPAEEANDTAAYLAGCLGPMLSQLCSSERDVLRRIDVDGESQADVARTSGVSPSTLKSRVQRARRRLLERLEN